MTDCTEYQVLPSTLGYGEEWNLEFVLNKCDSASGSSNTLNGMYSENKGMFFFIGTRAENKWSYIYNETDESAEACSQIDAGEYVEDATIDKKKYVISEFYDPDPVFEWTEEDEDRWFYDFADGYTNYEYFDPVDFPEYVDGIDDYLDHGIGGYGFNVEGMSEILKPCKNPCSKTEEDDCCKYKYVVVPFFSCGCGKRYRRVKVKDDTPDDDFLSPCTEFGGNYISFPEGLGCDYEYIEPELNIEDMDYTTTSGMHVGIANQYYFDTDNKFMMFDRTCTGYRVDNWVEGTKMRYYGVKSKFKGNLFVLMNRTCTGYTVDNIRELMEKDSQSYDTYDDLYDNALGFYIDDNGALGYRLLTIDCSISGDDKTTIMSGSTDDGVISDCEWHCIHIRMFGFAKTMRMYFYVDGKLVHITKEIPKLRLRKLNDLDDLQEGVPYNISIGGGTQGLAETVLENYMLNPYRVYPLEKYFAGSFIGYFKSFKFYTSHMDFSVIHNNFKCEKDKWLANNIY